MPIFDFDKLLLMINDLLVIVFVLVSPILVLRNRILLQNIFLHIFKSNYIEIIPINILLNFFYFLCYLIYKLYVSLKSRKYII